MMVPIPSVMSALAGVQEPAASRAGQYASAMDGIPGGVPAASFAEELAGAVGRVEESAKTSDALRDRLLRGENVELHTVAIQAQDAQISFELLLQVRNKLIQGYQEIMRMQI